MYVCVMMLLLFSYMESEHNFMARYSQDDLISSARNVSIYTALHMHGICTYFKGENVLTYIHC